MARRYLAHPLPPPGPGVLPPDIGHHVAHVLRGRPGDVVVLHDGRGLEAEATLADAATARRRSGEVPVVIGEPRPTRAPEPSCRLHVVFAPPRGARADQVFEHGCELGIHRFHPVQTQRSRANQRERGADTGRVARWRRLVAAAAGQCDRGLVPEVEPPRPLHDVLASSLPRPAFVAVPGATRPIAPLPPGTAEATLFVGPEGGFAPEEIDAIVAEACAEPIGLGPLILRAETAVLAGAAVLLLAGHGIGNDASSAKLK
jgi:16S rRNA (uracil1498-N3)-methyltransferase